jgi:site-specific DNA-methyltransferase (adenine-specific)/site-specific DNA-methyltransferase (cytosine-N4-specific)
MAALMGGEQIGIGFTSPPYASQRVYDESSGFKPIKPDAYVEWFDAVQANVSAHLAEDGSWFVNIKEHCDDGQRSLYVKDLTIAHVRAWGWRFVDEFCWERIGMPGRYYGRFKNAWEPIAHYTLTDGFKFNAEAVGVESDSIPVYSLENHLNPVGSLTGVPATREQARSRSKDRAMRSGLALPSNRLPPYSTTGTPHSAAFPVGLPVFFVKAYTDPDCIVFDPFMGGGTTLIAAAQEGRRGYGCEISPGYCDVIRRRWTTWAKTHDQEPGPGALE